MIGARQIKPRPAIGGAAPADLVSAQTTQATIGDDYDTKVIVAATGQPVVGPDPVVRQSSEWVYEGDTIAVLASDFNGEKSIGFRGWGVLAGASAEFNREIDGAVTSSFDYISGVWIFTTGIFQLNHRTRSFAMTKSGGLQAIAEGNGPQLLAGGSEC